MKSPINWAAILVAAVVYMILGMAWYMAWGNTWLTASGLTIEQAQQGSTGLLYGFSFASAIVFAITLNWLLNRLGARSFADGFKYAFIVTIVFVFLSMMNENNYLLRPKLLGLINGLYPVLSISVMGGIIAAWRKGEAQAPKASMQA